MSKTFQELFGREPRTVQSEALAWLNADRGEGEGEEEAQPSRKFVVEAPTGSGKTLLGLRWLYEKLGERKGVYVVSTKSLQLQVAHDAKCMDCEVVCLFGRDNYACGPRLASALAELTQLRTKRRKTDGPSGQHHGCAADAESQARVLAALRNGAEVATGDEERLLPKRLFERLCRDHGLDPDANAQSELWTRVSAKGCECLKKTMGEYWPRRRGMNDEEWRALIHGAVGCDFGRRLFSVGFSDVLIINMALFLTYLYVCPAHLCHRSVVVDEAHLLADGASQLYGPRSPPALDRSHADVVASAAAAGVPLVEGAPWNAFNAFAAAVARSKDNDRVALLSRSDRPKQLVRALWPALTLDAPSVSTLRAVNRIVVKLLGVVLAGRRRHAEMNPDADAGACDSAVMVETRNMVWNIVEQHRPLLPDVLAAKIPEEVRGWPADSFGDEDGVRRRFEGLMERAYAPGDRIRRVMDAACRIARARFLDDACQQTFKALARFYEAVECAEGATYEGDWLADDARSGFMPVYSAQNGVTYEASESFVARCLSAMWRTLDDALIMSATLTYVQDSATPFRMFQEEVGLCKGAPFDKSLLLRMCRKLKRVDGDGQMVPPMDYEVECLHLAEVFDRSLVHVRAPPMPKYNHKVKAEYRQREQVPRIVAAIRTLLAEHKSALVISPSTEEADELHRMMVELGATPTMRHIRFEDAAAFTEFKRTPSMRAVIYGTKGMAVGVDLPGRVGVVVISRPFNAPPQDYKKDYEALVDETYDNSVYWDRYRFKRDQGMSQAAGRLQRCPTDSGTVVILGEQTRTHNSAAEALRLHLRRKDPVDRSPM